MKQQLPSAFALALAISVCPIPAAAPVFAQSAPGSSAAGPAPAGVHADTAPSSCDRYLPAGFVFPPAAQTTLVSFHADPAGNLGQVSLYRSSGNSALDSAALACVAGQHAVSIRASGRAIEASWIGGVFWGARFHDFDLSSPTGQPNLCPNYPPIALRMNQEGTATLTFQIAPDGSVRDVALTKSTGWPVLDKATLDCVAGYRYFPVTQNGQPIVTDRTVSVAWRLGLPSGIPFVQVAMDEDGSLLIEGRRFADADGLKGKLSEIRSRNPAPALCIVVARGTAFRAVSQAEQALNDAGAPAVPIC